MQQSLLSQEQEYDITPVINDLRGHVDAWRKLPNPADWSVTPETARLLEHWRHYGLNNQRPFFCQVEAAETAIWLVEVAPKRGEVGKRFLKEIANANYKANPELLRIAFKLATGAAKTTVMAMLIAWQTLNAVRRSGSSNFSRGFLIVAPGLTINKRLRVLQPNHPENYYKHREIVPADMLQEIDCHYQLPRFQVARADGAFPRNESADRGTQRADEHPRNRLRCCNVSCPN